MLGLVDLIVLVAAGTAVMTAWFFGSIFESTREYFKGLKTGGRLIGTLMCCPLCLSYHTALLVTLLWLPGTVLAEPWATASRAPLIALAVATGIHFAHGILPANQEEPDDDERPSAQDDPEA